MDINKIHEIKKGLGIEDAQLDDFSVALGGLHSNLNSAIEIASSILSGREESQFEESYEDEGGEDQAQPELDFSFYGESFDKNDDQGDGPVAEDITEKTDESRIDELTASLKKVFESGGLVAVDRKLEESIGELRLNLESLSPFRENVEYFVREYGFTEFIQSKFLNISSSLSGEEAPPTGVPEDESLNIPPVSGPIKRKPFRILDKLNLSQNIYNNMNIEQAFFEAENTESTYFARLIKAQEDDESVNALNFHEVFNRLGDAAKGIELDESFDPPRVVLSIDYMNTIRETLIGRLQALNNAVDLSKGPLSNILSNQVDSKIDEFERHRRAYANALDDIVAAVKKRDSYLTAMVVELKKKGFEISEPVSNRAYELSRIIRDENSEVFKLLFSLAKGLVFLDVEGDIHQFGYTVTKKFKENYDGRLKEVFEDIFHRQLKNKIKMFFDENNNEGWSRSSFCYYLAGSIKRKYLQEMAYQREFNVVTTSWNYASCSMCGKNIYTRKRQDTPRGAGRREPVSVREYSEYQTDLYSLFRNDGSVITDSDLKLETDGITAKTFKPPPTLATLSDDPPVDMTWDEIETMVYSGARRDHIDGIKRRAWALKQLGARKVPSRSGEVSNIKFKCHYKNVSDRPLSLQRLEKGKSDFVCGLYLDPSPLLVEGAGAVSAASLQAVRPTSEDISSDELFELKLDEAINKGLLGEDRKEEFLAELARRRGGGWKFSNKYFNCPSRISPEEVATAVAAVALMSEEETAGRSKPVLEKLAVSKLLRKYSYIASPIAGPISEEKLTQEGAGASQIYPPVDSDGVPAELAPGTMSYLICGAQTSLSSFSRNINETGSLPNIFKTLLSQARDEPLLEEKVLNLVETLLSLGVDISDIQPFLSNISNPEVAIAQLEGSGRLKKISNILVLAMASPVNLETSLRGASFNRMDLLGDIKLVCSHGHRFTIKDSVYFGKTHTGINLRNARRSKYMIADVIRSGVLTTEGQDNFERTLGLLSKRGYKYIVPVDLSATFGSKERVKYTYEDWVGRKIGVNRVIFEAPGSPDAYYGFGAVPKNYIWGSEESYDLSSARHLESRDIDTIIEIENNSEEALHGDSRDKQRTNNDAATRAAKRKFDVEGPSLMGNKGSYQGMEGVVRATTPIGVMLKSFAETVQDWLTLSTSLEVRGALTGKPIPFTSELIEAVGTRSARPSLGQSARGMIELVIRYVEEEDEDIISDDSTSIIELAFSKFKANYFPELENIDVRLLGSIGRPLNEKIIKNIVSSVIEAAADHLGTTDEEKQSILSIYRNTLLTEDGSSIAVDHLLSIDYGGNSFKNLLEQFKESFLPELSKKDTGRALYDPLAVKQKALKDEAGSDYLGVDPGYYQGGIKQKTEGVNKKIAYMKGKMFMGRVLQAASALYLADAIVNVFNFYMRDQRSREYIGYDIGIDLSTSDKVLALSGEDLNKIVIGVDEATAEMMNNHAEVFYEFYFDNIAECVNTLKNEMFLIRTACTSSKYMKKATLYIRENLNEIVGNLEEAASAAEGSEGSADLERAKDIINNAMTNEPFTTIDLNSNGKYRRFFGGSGADKDLVPPQDTHSIMPLFGTYLAKYNGGGHYYPIFALTGKGVVYHSFDMNIPEPIMINNLYVLYAGDLPNAVELEDLYDRLPDIYKKNGWKIYNVNIGRSKDEYALTKGSMNDGFKGGVSLIYHPATSPIIPDGSDQLIGYRNDEVGFDSSQAIHVGSLAMRDGKDNLFPPSPLDGVSDVGIPIPLDYENEDSHKVRASRKLFPVVGARIPISLPTSVPGAPIELDISDFLMRDPPEIALKILRRIGFVYNSYKLDLKKAISDGATTSAQDRVKDRYKKIISALFDSYRGLPYRVQNAKSGTKTEALSGDVFRGERPPEGAPAENPFAEEEARRGRPVTERFAPRVSSYIPLVDWVTMHRMISGNEFGPRWGGHQLWEEESGDESANERREAIEQFIISVHGLDKLAALIGERLDSLRKVERGTTFVDPTDLLNPDERLFKRGVITKEECWKLFHYAIGEDEDTYTSDDGFPWMRLRGEHRSDAETVAGQKMFKHFVRWVKGLSSYYPIGIRNEVDDATGEPSAYIRVMNVIFPSNSIGTHDEISPRERIERVRDSDRSDVLNIKDLYSHAIISGEGGDVQYYPIPTDPGELKEYLSKLKGVRHISVQRQADAISEYLIEYIAKDLFPGLKKESVYRFGKIKYSKKLKTDMYYSSIIKNAKLYALWKFLTD